jgi:hypothetical protein
MMVLDPDLSAVLRLHEPGLPASGLSLAFLYQAKWFRTGNPLYSLLPPSSHPGGF